MSDAYAYPEQPFYAPGWQEPEPAREPLAVAALVTGVLALGPVAVALGVVALRRVRRLGRRGRGLALAGTALGALGTLGWVAVVAVLVATAAATRPLPADVDAPRDARAVQLVTGSCVADLPEDGPVDRVRVVPCADPHRAQVVTSYEFPSDADWPGAAEASDTVAAACRLTDAERASGLTAVVWAPTALSWSRGDRTGLCLARSAEPTTGSLLGG